MSSKRINFIVTNTPEFKYAYDLCCDHAFIGLEYHKLYPNSHIKYLDINPKVNAAKLDGFELADLTTYKFSHIDNSVFFLCGVGGHLGIKILKNILGQDVDKTASFVFCIHQFHEEFKDFLDEVGMSYMAKYIVDKGRGYELLFSGEDCPKDDSTIAKRHFFKERKEYLSRRRDCDIAKKWTRHYSD